MSVSASKGFSGAIWTVKSPEEKYSLFVVKVKLSVSLRVDSAWGGGGCVGGVVLGGVVHTHLELKVIL